MDIDSDIPVSKNMGSFEGEVYRAPTKEFGVDVRQV